MNYLTAAIDWILDPANQHGPTGIWARVGEHLTISATVVLIASLIGIPLGYFVGHTKIGKNLVVGATGAARALPTLGLMTLFALVFGIGLVAPMCALTLLAIPAILAGAYSGIDSVEPAILDAARAQGMSGWQILTQVEIPLGLPQLISGIRTAMIQVLATATVAAYIGAGGLGRFLFLGLDSQDYAQMLAASVLIVALALTVEIVLEPVERISRKLLHTRPDENE